MTRTGYAPGVYDLFHVGHLNILREARRRCDRLVAGVTSDELTVRLKGRRPVVPLEERLEIVRGLRCVDEAVVESAEDKLETWRQVGFDVIFKGDDWRGTPKCWRSNAVSRGSASRSSTSPTPGTLPARSCVAPWNCSRGPSRRGPAQRSSRNHLTRKAAMNSTWASSSAQ